MKEIGIASVGIHRLLDGQSVFVFVRYSAFSDGRDMTEESREDTKYLGVASSASSTPPTLTTDYTWSLIKGEDGKDGTSGSSAQLLYLSSSSDVMTFDYNESPLPASQAIVFEAKTQNITGDIVFTATPYIGTVAQANITLGGTGKTRTLIQSQFLKGVTRIEVKATIGSLVDTVSVSKIKDGKVGNGISRTEIKYQASSDGVTVPTGTWLTTIPTVAENQYLWTRTQLFFEDGTSTTAYSIGKIGAQGTPGKNGVDGKDGAPGVPGATGADGKTTYTWIRYADNAVGGGITDDPTGKKYIGMAYNKTTPTESSIPLDYVWSLIKGEDGKTGAAGANGETTYTWVRYSPNQNGSAMTTEPGESTKYIGIAVNKTTSTPSTTPTDYTWSKFIGDDGSDGVGVIRTEVKYQAATNGVTPPTTWLTDIPVVAENQYLWTRTQIFYSDATSSVSYSIGKMGTTGKDGTNGKDGEAGKDGNGILSTEVRYQASTSGTVTPTGTWVTTIPAVTADQYLWTRTQIFFEDTTSSTSYAIGKMGANGKDGISSIVGTLTNESITLAASSTGVITDYSKATGVFRVYDGVTLISSGVTFSILSKSGADGTINATTGAYSVTSLTTDIGAISLRAIYKGVTIDRTVSLSKSKAGEAGKEGQSSYTWVRYSANANGTPMTETPISTTQYFGVAVTSTATAPSSPTSYTWSKSKGEEGNGISKAEISYQASSSGTVPPTATWANSVPSVPNGQYLWTRTVTTYTNAVKDTSYSVSRMGENGVNGENSYFRQAWADSLDGTKGFSITISEGKKFLGTYVDINPVQSTDPKKYNWIELAANIETSSRNLILYDNIEQGGVNVSAPNGATNLETNGVANTRLRTKELIEIKGNLSVSIHSNHDYYLMFFDANKGYTGVHSNVWQSGSKIFSDVQYIKVVLKHKNDAVITQAEFKNIKLMITKSNRESQWLPAPEDMEKTVNSLSFTVDNVKDITDYKTLMPLGRSLYTDVNFESGSNGMVRYNNSGGETVIITRRAFNATTLDNPSGRPYMEIKTTGVAAPGHGGFISPFNARMNAKYIHRLLAKIPVGLKVVQTYNTMGVGATAKALTPTEGTGKWEEYVFLINCGHTGPFSSGGHIYVANDTQTIVATPTNPVTWYVDAVELVDITQTNQSQLKLLSDGIEARVEKDGIISAFNMSPESIKLNAMKIDLNGRVSFSDLDSVMQSDITKTNDVLTAYDTSIINTNPMFFDWKGTLPAGYGAASLTNGATLSKISSSNGKGNAVRFTVTSDASQAYLAPGLITNQPYYEYMTAEMTFMLTSGTIDGAGGLFRYRSTTGILADHKLNLKELVPNPVLNRWYTVTKVIRQANGLNFNAYEIFPMGAWTNIALTTPKVIQFDSIKARASTEQEINAYLSGTKLEAWSSSDKTLIDGGKIYTNSIKANSISVNTLSALSSNLGDITGGSIKIGGTAAVPNFWVQNNGSVSATNLNITGGSIKVGLSASGGPNFSVDSKGNLAATGTISNVATDFPSPIDGSNVLEGGFNFDSMRLSGVYKIRGGMGTLSNYVSVAPGEVNVYNLSGGDVFASDRVLTTPYGIEMNSDSPGGSSFNSTLMHSTFSPTGEEIGLKLYSNKNIILEAVEGLVFRRAQSEIKTIMSGNTWDAAGTAGNMYVRPAKGGETRITIAGSTNEYAPIKAIRFLTDNGGVFDSTGTQLIVRHTDASSTAFIQAGVEIRATKPSAGTTYIPVRASAFPTGSKVEFKENIIPFNGKALDLIEDSDIYNYNLKSESDNPNRKLRTGLVIGEGYRTPKLLIDGDGIEQYAMTSVAWKAIQELSEVVRELKEELLIANLRIEQIEKGAEYHGAKNKN